MKVWCSQLFVRHQRKLLQQGWRSCLHGRPCATTSSGALLVWILLHMFHFLWGFTTWDYILAVGGLGCLLMSTGALHWAGTSPICIMREFSTCLYSSICEWRSGHIWKALCIGLWLGDRLPTDASRNLTAGLEQAGRPQNSLTTR